MITEERESIFITDDSIKEWTISSYQSKMWTKIERQGYKPYKTETMEGVVVCKYYKIPYSCVSIRKNVKREMSEEQKLAAAERMKKMRENKSKS